MTVNAKPATEILPRVKNILIAQKTPANMLPYQELAKRFDVRIDFVPFHSIEGYTEREYRKQRVYPTDFTSIVFTSKTAVDHFFRLCDEMRLKMPDSMKYFGLNETIANYLQKFINFRKRKVVNGQRTIDELKPALLRNKTEKFFLPCHEGGNPEISGFFASINIPIQEVEMYRTVFADLSHLADIKYDILAFFTQTEIDSLFDNFPDFQQEDRRICVYGTAVNKVLTERGLRVDIVAGTPEVPSIAVALENYLKISNG